MAVNCRFSTGVHVLVLLAAKPDTLQTSTDIAEKLDTNPVVVRRVLASLQQAKLIESQKGPTGGSRLLKSPKAISLADVYKAVETGALFHTPHVRAAGPVRVNNALEKVFSSSMVALLDDFRKTTLSQVMKRVEKPGKR
ncbi:MAG TPA: Rrf2 family transcriptional regulator [Acidobacteriaceae bacterium]|nr:Rrf2 family transcriptional regulator [Nitrospira sp.]HEV2275161.1 Rrf2 family transcriptional regulator [Acidobacteriaceae bacterium]